MNKWQSSILLFLLFWIISFVFYFKTAGAGFVTDEVGWLQTYKDTGWHGIFHAFGDKSLHYIYHFIGYLIWKIFELNGFAWMVIFISLHSAIAVLSFRIFETLFLKLEITSSSLIAFTGCLLFVVSPYQTEPLVWYACIHYLACSFLLFSAFYFLLLYLQQQSKSLIFAFYACFIVSLFTLEISFAFPIILIVFFLLWPPKVFSGNARIELIKIFVAPSFVLLACYFLLCKILRGSAVGHYGAAAHLNFSIPLLMGNLAKYVSKIFFLTQFISADIRQQIYNVFENEKFGWCLFGVLTMLALLFLLFLKRAKTAFRASTLLFSFFVIALLPILNLIFSYIVNIEGDRFSYFASIFAYQFVAFSCILLFRKFGWLLLATFLFFNVKFLSLNTQSWSCSKIIQQSLIAEFKWYNAEKIYLLNIPDNFRGAYMFRCFAPDISFAESIALITGKNIEPKTVEVVEYNMNSFIDSVVVEKISDSELKVTFAQWGNWWWSKGIGASNYSTKDYDVKIDEWNHSYLLRFKSKPANAVYIYQCGEHWREVKNF